MRFIALAAVLLPFIGCGGAHYDHTLRLLQSAGIPYTETPSRDTPLEVVTRSTAVRDPLPVEGADMAYSDIEAALGFAVASATSSWASQHVHQHPEGWQLFVEFTAADAKYVDGRLIVAIVARATLRTRVGHVYLAQTQTACSQGGVIPVERGGTVVYACMMRIGRDLTDWLGGIDS
jgi:hypothetical protein